MYVHTYVQLYVHMQLCTNNTIIVTGFVKRDLIHASNFSTSRRCNSACS